MSYSVLTITHGRGDRLANLIAGANQSSLVPAEIVVVFMSQRDEPKLESTVPVRRVHVEGEPLPLAAARNLAATSASTNTLIFLDVDCIPARDLARVLIGSIATNGGIVMATPRYLREPPTIPLCFDDLHLGSVEHPGRSKLAVGPVADYNAFWSLCFGMTGDDFSKVGGFDTDYAGYGAEDTDFARRAQRASVPLHLASGVAYHQFHQTHRPPLNHFEDIVRNAKVFFRKWQAWPMEGWLRQFNAGGYIAWDTGASDIMVLRRPTDLEIAASRSDDAFG